jgi:hypothetical protein
MLRKNGTPEDLQQQWIGHSSLRTTDRYLHTNQELEYRRPAATKAGLNFDFFFQQICYGMVDLKDDRDNQGTKLFKNEQSPELCQPLVT